MRVCTCSEGVYMQRGCVHAARVCTCSEGVGAARVCTCSEGV